LIVSCAFAALPTVIAPSAMSRIFAEAFMIVPLWLAVAALFGGVCGTALGRGFGAIS
jgi:hypothetical protein